MPYYIHFHEILLSAYRNFTATFDRNALLIYHKFLFVKFRYVYLLKKFKFTTTNVKFEFSRKWLSF